MKPKQQRQPTYKERLSRWLQWDGHSYRSSGRDTEYIIENGGRRRSITVHDLMGTVPPIPTKLRVIRDMAPPALRFAA